MGALLAGITADLLGVSWAIATIGGLTFLSGVIVLARMYETRPRAKPSVASTTNDRQIVAH